MVKQLTGRWSEHGVHARRGNRVETICSDTTIRYGFRVEIPQILSEHGASEGGQRSVIRETRKLFARHIDADGRGRFFVVGDRLLKRLAADARSIQARR